MEEIIATQLAAYPVLKRQARISYHSNHPLEQVHTDTGFYQPPGTPDLVPILVFVDVATRFTKFYVQTRKNESIFSHFEDFKEALLEKHPEAPAETTLIISDGAKELKKAFSKRDGIRHKVSTGLNKAVLAEVKIRQLRAVIREYERAKNIASITSGKVKRTTTQDLAKIVALAETRINTKSGTKPRKSPKGPIPPRIPLATPVFALNLFKFHQAQMGKHWSALRKLSYDQNWFYEPFFVTKTITFNGITKYRLGSHTSEEELDYYFYADQLQVIDPRIAAKYVEKWVDFTKANPSAK